MSDLRYLQNISEDGEATILLYGQIGTVVNGSDFANQIAVLNADEKVTKIKVKINSVGGSVIEGYSIISAIINSTKPVETYVEGLAASIAGVIALCGTKVYMNDYSTLMLHNPSGSNDLGLLELIKNTLVTILSNNTNLTSDELSVIMDEETYFTSKEAAKMGLVSEVINTNKKIKVSKLSIQEMENVYNKLINPVKMILVKNILNLDESSEEAAIVESIEALQNDIKALNEALEAEKTAKEALQNEIDAIALAKEEARKEEVSAMVNSYLTSGKIKEEEVESLVNLASVDFASVKNMLDKIGTKTVTNIMNVIKSEVAVSNGRESWTIRDFEKKDPNGLAKIKNETPEVYTRMYNEFYKK